MSKITDIAISESGAVKKAGKTAGLKAYMRTNASSLLNLSLGAAALASFVPPAVGLKSASQGLLPVVKDYLGRIPNDYVVGGLALLLLCAALSWKSGAAAFRRHRNTFIARRPRISSVGRASWFLILFVALAWIKEAAGLRAFAVASLVLFSLGLLGRYLAGRGGEAPAATETDALQLSDEPIESSRQDLLARAPFVDRLYKEIASIPFVDSFVFGLYGAYGDGKTSVIRLLKNKLHGDSNFLVVEFDPWNFKDEATILPAFYGEIERAISREFALPGFKRALLKYQKLLAPEISPFGIKFKLSPKDESLEDVKRRIESYIAQTGRKLLIVFDDIDRLQPNEILFVFKLVRLHAKLKNTIFLLSMNRLKVGALIQDKVGGDAQEYIEKIVQKPVPLPSIEPKDVERLLDAHLERIFENIGVTPEQKARFNEKAPGAYHAYIKRLFKNIRQVKTFLHSLGSSLPPVKGEVDLYDFFALELIRVFYPKVYDDIWRNPWAYIPVEWSDELYLLSPFRLIKGEQKVAIIKPHLEAVIRGEQQPDVLQKLLESIFLVVKDAFGARPSGSHGSASIYRTQKLITHPGSFKKYFTLNVPATEIPDEQVTSAMREWASTVGGAEREAKISEALFEMQQQGKLRELLMKLLVFEKEMTPQAALSIIRVIYRNASKFSLEGTENLWQSEWDDAHRLLIWLVNDKVEAGEMQAVLEEVVLGTPDMPFAVKVINFCENRKGQGSLYNIYASVDINALKRKFTERLDQHYRLGGANILAEHPERGGWKYVFYHWATDWEAYTGDGFKAANEYMLRLCEADPKSLITVVEYLVQSREVEGRFGRSDDNERVYDFGGIRGLAEAYKKDKRLTPEEGEVLDRLLSPGEASEPPYRASA